MDSLICTNRLSKASSNSSMYLYLPNSWRYPYYPCDDGETPVCGLNLSYYSSGKELFIWRTDRSNFSLDLYLLSGVGNRYMSDDGVWRDMDYNPITAAPTTLEEIKLYQTFL